MTGEPVSSKVFVHEGLYYTNLDEYLAGTVPFIRHGLADGDPVLVAVPADRHEPLRAALGAEAERVSFRDMAEAGRNPNRIIPWVLNAFIAEQRPRRARIIGEPIFVGRGPDEIGPCVQHEALINVAFADVDASILCPYDVARLPHIVSDAEHTHPVIVEADGTRRPGDYRDPDEVVEMHNRPFAEPATVDEALVFGLSRLAQVRRTVARHAAAAGLPDERAADAQVAVTEIATNALSYGGPGVATLRAWSDRERVVYEIRGAGKISDPMAGRVVPPPEVTHGRGLLVANRLCDLVLTHTVLTGTVTRLHLSRVPHPTVAA
jgi:anti-sigma regulatory factor (Ser/Thr protein kinase)